MAAPDKILLDGVMAYGTAVATINSVTYKVISATVGRPVTWATDHDENGNPSRERGTREISTLDLELQLATSTTVYPQFGQTFSYTVDITWGSETWKIESCIPNISNEPGAIRTLRVNARTALGAITTVA